MTTIEIRNFRRCERADLSGGPLLLVAGNNANGKTSVLTAIAAAGARLSSPEDRTKAEAQTLVLHGQEQATVSIETDGGSVRLQLPSFKTIEDGAGVTMSRIAAGLESLVDISPAQRAAFLSQWIKAEPTEEDLLQAVKDAGLRETLSGAIWKAVQESGWNGAHKQAQESGTKLKGKWESLTASKRWGVNAGANWLPDGWREELRGITIEDAQAAVKRAAEELETAVASAAISADEMKKLEESAALLGQAKEQLAKREAAYAAAVKRLEDLRAERDELPIASGNVSELPCPCCGGILRIIEKDGVRKLIESPKDEMSEAQRKEMRVKIAQLDGDIANATAEARAASQSLEAGKAAVLSATKSGEKLAAAKGKKGSADALSDARAAVEKAAQDADMVEVYVNATKTHSAIVTNLAIQLILSDGGLRKTVLNRKMKDFNEKEIAPVYKAAGWPAVTLDANMEPMFDGFTYRDLSKSHQWIARTVLQIAIAKLDGSDMVLLDEADLLDKGNRNRLFGMLVKLKQPAVIGMTVNVPNLVPDLAAKKVGESYWIEAGIAKPLAKAIAA